MKILSKYLHLSEDVCRLLADRKIKERRSESSIVDEILRIALNQQNKSEDFQRIQLIGESDGTKHPKKKGYTFEKEMEQVHLSLGIQAEATYVRCIKR